MSVSKQRQRHFYESEKSVFLMCRLGWFNEAEWPIYFPIIRNQSSPDRSVFIQSGFIWNDFWWPLFMSHSCWNASSSVRSWSLLFRFTPSWPELISCTVQDWISHTYRIHTLSPDEVKSCFCTNYRIATFPQNLLTATCGGSSVSINPCLGSLPWCLGLYVADHLMFSE